MKTEPVKTFSRMFRGYDPAAVDTYIEVLIAKHQWLVDEVESLRSRLKESGEEAAALRIEVACLRDEVAVLSDTSPSSYAMQHRMAKMLRHAVDEVSRMQAEARADAETLIAAAEANAEAAQREHEELSAETVAQRKALEAQCEETRKQLDVELAGMRVETQSAIDEAWRDAQQEREQLLADAKQLGDQLLADAKQRADHYHEQARRAVDEASQQRIMILEQLVGVAHDLEGFPATLESAYQERKNAPESGVVVPLDQKIKQRAIPQ
jgi:cell division septum initiation protein DivIVA